MSWSERAKRRKVETMLSVLGRDGVEKMSLYDFLSYWSGIKPSGSHEELERWLNHHAANMNHHNYMNDVSPRLGMIHYRVAYVPLRGIRVGFRASCELVALGFTLDEMAMREHLDAFAALQELAK